MKLISMQFISLDGVYQGPGSPEEDRSDGFDRGGWLVPFIDDVFEQQVDKWVANADAFLFGRRTYDAFAAVWPTITSPQDLNAAQLNRQPKYVATSRPFEASWGPVTVFSDDVIARVAELKRTPGRELQIHGSGRFANAMVRAGLVDEIRLIVAPVVVGDGRRLFTHTDGPIRFDLVDQVRTPAGLSLVTLAAGEGAASGTYKRV